MRCRAGRVGSAVNHDSGCVLNHEERGCRDESRPEWGSHKLAQGQRSAALGCRLRENQAVRMGVASVHVVNLASYGFHAGDVPRIDGMRQRRGLPVPVPGGVAGLRLAAKSVFQPPPSW